MKATKQLNELTVDELYARKQKLRGALTGLGIVMLVALAVLGYAVGKSQSYSLLAVTPAMFLGLLPAILALNKVNEEIKARKAA